MSFMRSIIVFMVILAVLTGAAQAQAVKSNPGRILVNSHVYSGIVFDNESGKSAHGFLAFDQIDEIVRMARQAGHMVDVASIHHLSEQLLASYDVVLMPMPAIMLTSEDIAILRAFIARGGGVGITVASGQVLFAAPMNMTPRENISLDMYPRLSNMALFTGPYGITFGNNTRDSVLVSIDQQSPLAGPLMAKNVLMPYGYATLVIDPSKAAAAATLPGLNRVLVAYATDKALLGKGRLVVCGNSFGFFDNFARKNDNLAFMRNMLEYLLSEDATPDYAIISHGITAKKTLPGDTIGVSATVKNVSATAAPATNLSISLYTYNDKTKTAGTLVKKLKSVSVSALAAGAQNVHSSEVRIPGTVQPGAYVIVFAVDPQQTTADTNIANNTRISRKFSIR